MYLRASDDFSEIAWEDPADAEIEWWCDRNHVPLPLPPLAVDLTAEWVRVAFNGGRSLAVNGYLFMDPTCEPEPREFETGPVAAWDAEHQTRVAAVARRIRGLGDGSDPREALAQFDVAIQESAEAFGFTIAIIGGLFPPMGGLIRFCTKRLGREGPLEAMTILGGEPNATIESAQRLEELAVRAGGDARLRDAIRAGDMAAIRQTAPDFADEFDRYLAEFGWRCRSWFDVQDETWTENPSEPLGIIARYIDLPEQRPSAQMARAAADREAAIARLEREMSAEERTEFNSMIADLRGAVRVVEERALWQMIAFAALRVPALALGRSLVEAGRIESPEDVFYLSRTELAALTGERGPSDTTTLVQQRRNEVAKWETLIPPVSLGKNGLVHVPPPTMGSADVAGVRRLAERGARVIAGVGVSRGEVRGRAVVATSVADAEARLQPGDILVCPSTSPPWTPLFSIAAGVVTDAGGMLSHTSITAREYGIPAVVATVRGTRDIPDGAVISIDGAGGTVAVEETGR